MSKDGIMASTQLLGGESLVSISGPAYAVGSLVIGR